MADEPVIGGKPATLISQDVEIVGTIKCNEGIQINGRLNGDLICSGDAIIGEKAIIKGNLSVNGITVLGQVNGNITAKDRIELKSSARVSGDIRSKRLMVVDGVTFVGKAEVNPSGVQPAHDAAGRPADNTGAEADDAKRPAGAGVAKR